MTPRRLRLRLVRAACALSVLSAWAPSARSLEAADPPSFLLTLSSTDIEYTKTEAGGDAGWQARVRSDSNVSWIGYSKAGVVGVARFELLPEAVPSSALAPVAANMSSFRPTSFAAPRLRISHPSWASDCVADFGIVMAERLTEADAESLDNRRTIVLDFKDPGCPLVPLRVECTPVTWRRSPDGAGLAALAVEIRLHKEDAAFQWRTRDGAPLPERTPRAPEAVPQSAWPAEPPDLPSSRGAAPPEESFPGSSGIYVEGGLYFESGDYGTDVHSRMLYAPLTLGGWYDRFQGSVTVPLIAMNYDDGSSDGDSPLMNTEAGLGDIWISVGCFALNESEGQPYVLLQADVKLPTADENRGLGTGEFDAGGRLTVGKRLWGPLKGYAQAGYGAFGDPVYVSAGYDAAWTGGLGTGYDLGRGHEAWIHLKGNTEIVEGTGNALSAYLQYAGPLFSNDQVSVLLGAGLTEGSPDYLIGVSYRIYIK